MDKPPPPQQKMTRQQAEEIYRQWANKDSEQGFIELLVRLQILKFEDEPDYSARDMHRTRCI